MNNKIKKGFIEATEEQNQLLKEKLNIICTDDIMSTFTNNISTIRDIFDIPENSDFIIKCLDGKVKHKCYPPVKQVK